ncbi:MAG TPA: manganese efflux pump [Candidatus Paceibacterota bacterium]|jgi:putative Mn2+ efflux pump MntP
MSLLEVLALALSLSLDTTVVSIGAGTLNRLSWLRALFIALTLSVFHVVMLVVGFLAAGAFTEGLEYARIVSFVLLLGIGLKMLFDALKKEDDDERNLLQNGPLLAVAFATSVDALVVGISLSFIGASVTLMAVALGIMTFVLSLLGVYFGMHSKRLIGPKIEILGALVLIALAFKILFTIA